MHEQTDKQLTKLEKKITREYNKAYKTVKAKADAYFKQFAAADARMLARLKANEITLDDYTKWREKEMLTGESWRALRDSLAADLVNTDKIAAGMIHNSLPDVYAMNFNYGTYEIENGYQIDTSFALYDRATVQRLMSDDPRMIPRPRVDIPKDMRWNRNKITSAMTQAVLSGDSIPHIAERLRGVTTMDRNASIRNARTYTTSAENAGRTDSYKRANDLGINVEQQWVAMWDGRTRSSHRHLDGERIKVGEKFSNGLRYPADPEGAPEEIYNCRCRIIGALVGFERQKLADSNYKMGGMTYDEWKNGKKKRVNNDLTAQEKIMQMRKNLQTATSITEADIKAAGKIFAEEVTKNGYVGEMQKSIDDAYQTYLDAGHAELTKINNDPKYAEARQLMRGLKYMDESEYFKTSEEVEEFFHKTGERAMEIKNSQLYRDANMAYEKAISKARYDWVGNANNLYSELAKVREMGVPEELETALHTHLNNSRSPMRGIIETTYEYYPTDWVRASVNGSQLTPKKGDRGYYSNWRNEICISGSSEKSQIRCALHELGHRFEYIKPSVRDAEEKFYDRRTEGEELEWLGSGYRRDEKTRKDNFIDPYMGKDYGGNAYELVSMGFETAYCDPIDLAKDPDMQEWIYGILCLM